MDHDEVEELIKIWKDIEKAMGTTIRIDTEQVMDIVVADLLGKYKHAVKCGLSSEADMLECVLLKYYLEQEELEKLMAA